MEYIAHWNEDIYIYTTNSQSANKCLWVMILASQVVEERRKQEWTTQVVVVAVVGSGLQQLLLLWVHERKLLVMKPYWRTRDLNALWSAKEKRKKDFNATLNYKPKKRSIEGWVRSTDWGRRAACLLVFCIIIAIDLVLNKHMLNGLLVWPLVLPCYFQLIYFPWKCYCIRCKHMFIITMDLHL